MFSSTTSRLRFFTSSSCFLRPSPLLLDTGTVTFWGNRGGFGFIESDETRQRYFVHNKNCIFANGRLETYRSLKEGARVEFDLVPDSGISKTGNADRKFCCVNVTSIGGQPLPAGPVMNAFQQNSERKIQQIHGLKTGSENVKGRVARVWDGGRIGWIKPFYDENDGKDSQKTGLIFFHASSVDAESLKKMNVGFSTKEDDDEEAGKKKKIESNTGTTKRFVKVGGGGGASQEEKEKPASNNQQQTVTKESNQDESAQTPRRRVVKKITPTTEQNATVDSSATSPSPSPPPPSPPTVIVTSCELQFDDEVLFDVKTAPEFKEQRRRARDNHRWQVREERKNQRQENSLARDTMDIGGALLGEETTEQVQELPPVSKQNGSNSGGSEKNSWKHLSPYRKTKYQVMATNIRLVKRPLNKECLLGLKGIKGKIKFINYATSRKNELGQTQQMVKALVERKNKREQEKNEKAIKVQQQQQQSKNISGNKVKNDQHDDDDDDQEEEDFSSLSEEEKQEEEIRKYVQEIKDLPPLPWGFIEINPKSVPEEIFVKEEEKKKQQQLQVSLSSPTHNKRQQQQQNRGEKKQDRTFASIYFELPNYVADETSLKEGTKVTFDVEQVKTVFVERAHDGSSEKVSKKAVAVNIKW